MILSFLKKLLLLAVLVVGLDYLIVEVPESETVTMDFSVTDFLNDLRDSTDQA